MPMGRALEGPPLQVRVVHVLVEDAGVQRDVGLREDERVLAVHRLPLAAPLVLAVLLRGPHRVCSVSQPPTCEFISRTSTSETPPSDSRTSADCRVCSVLASLSRTCASTSGVMLTWRPWMDQEEGLVLGTRASRGSGLGMREAGLVAGCIGRGLGGWCDPPPASAGERMCLLEVTCRRYILFPNIVCAVVCVFWLVKVSEARVGTRKSV